jgi:hypothetical protein
VSSNSGTKDDAEDGIKSCDRPESLAASAFLKTLEYIKEVKYIFFFSFPETSSGQG